MDFQKVTSDVNTGIPDETTICRFRNKLAEKKLDKVLLKLVNKNTNICIIKNKQTYGYRQILSKKT